MFCQIKLPTRNITFSCDLNKIDIIELGKNPDLEDDVTMYILFYKADNDAPAFRINCAKLKTDELMDLFDWLCLCKRGDEAIPVYTIDMLKDK
jgi:hypothetical protein